MAAPTPTLCCFESNTPSLLPNELLLILQGLFFEAFLNSLLVKAPPRYIPLNSQHPGPKQPINKPIPLEHFKENWWRHPPQEEVCLDQITEEQHFLYSWANCPRNITTVILLTLYHPCKLGKKGQWNFLIWNLLKGYFSLLTVKKRRALPWILR